jgi:threonine/homoserine/homoserine lactone efflux protein
MLTYLILGATNAFAAAAQPGPFQTYVISESIRHGWRRTLPAAFAPLLSDGPVILVVMLILTRVPAWFAQGLRIAGGAFVLWLAYGALRAWRAYDAEKVTRPPSRRQSVLKAALVNVLNPNPYIGWSLVMGPLLLQGWHESPAHGVAFLAGFYGVLILTTAAIIVLFGAARKLGPRIGRALLGVSAAALACLGVYLLWTGVY